MHTVFPQASRRKTERPAGRHVVSPQAVARIGRGLWTAQRQRRDWQILCSGTATRTTTMPDDEKPKRTRSWREIDKGRDRGGSSRRSDRESDRFQQSTGYTKYKANLERLFSGGVDLPEHLRAKDDPAGEKEEVAEARKRLYAIAA